MRIASICVGMAFLGTSCSLNPGSGHPKSNADHTPAAVSKSDRGASKSAVRVISLPIDKYSLQGSSLEAVEGAARKITTECMKRLGYTYRPGDTVRDAHEENRRYGIQDASLAAQYGYRPYSVVHPPTVDPNAPTYSQAELTALTGKDKNGKKITAGIEAANGEKVPRGGCAGEADRIVRAPYDYPAGVEAARIINAEGFKNSTTDPKVRKIFREWSSCMRGKGYRYDSPLTVMGSAEFYEGEMSNRQMMTALADITCKEKVDLVSRWNAVESATEKVMISERSGILKTFLKRQNAKVAAARRILEG